MENIEQAISEAFMKNGYQSREDDFKCENCIHVGYNNHHKYYYCKLVLKDFPSVSTESATVKESDICNKFKLG